MTLPGFHWNKVENEVPRRTTHICALINKRQVINVGGYDRSVGDPGDWEDPDPWAMGIGIFDVPSMTWLDSYRPDDRYYESPEEIKAWYDNG